MAEFPMRPGFRSQDICPEVLKSYRVADVLASLSTGLLDARKSSRGGAARITPVSVKELLQEGASPCIVLHRLYTSKRTCITVTLTGLLLCRSWAASVVSLISLITAACRYRWSNIAVQPNLAGANRHAAPCSTSIPAPSEGGAVISVVCYNCRYHHQNYVAALYRCDVHCQTMHVASFDFPAARGTMSPVYRT